MTRAQSSPGELRVALLTGAPAWRGSSASYAKVARGLLERGHQALVLADDVGVAERMRQEGARAQFVALRDTGLGEFSRLRAALRSLRPHVLMADRPRDLRLAAIATLGWPTRLVYRYNLANRAYPGDPMSRFALRRAAGIVFQSRAIMRLAYERSPRLRRLQWARIPNGIDTTVFRPDPDAGRTFRRAHDIADDAWVVIQTSAIARGKGHDASIAAIARLSETADHSIVFVVAGEGKLAEQVKMQAGAAGILARFVGALPPPQLRAALAAADVVVHPSVMEIFPTAVAEAMACGCTVIATDTGGTSEVTGRRGRSARLVPVDDASALAQALGELLTDPARRAAMAPVARRRIEFRFPLTVMLDGYESFFHRLAEQA